MRYVRKLPAAALLLLLLLTAACSGGEGQTLDPSQVTPHLATEPEAVAAGQKITLIASFEGIPEREGEEVVFEIRKGKAALVEATEEESGIYKAEYTFPEAGIYDIYLHYYHGRDHIAKLVRLTVS